MICIAIEQKLAEICIFWKIKDGKMVKSNIL